MDRPIIFSGPMVRALLDGRKTMTRRLAMTTLKKPTTKIIGTASRTIFARPSPWQKARPGDRLWVRETAYVWSAGNGDGTGQRINYRATEPDCPTSWTPAIHMYRFASRLTLVVTAVKVEPLKDISHDDAVAEGCYRIEPCPEYPNGNAWGRAGFAILWDGLHGAGAFEASPEVVALTFTVHQSNIDALQSAA